MAQVSIERLRVHFGEVRAVDGVDLEIRDGELVVLLGPSGCGKTTTLRCVAGLERATSGQIRFDGRPVGDLPPSQRNIAMGFQFVSLYPHLRVRENIAFPLRARGLSQRLIREKIDWAAEVLQLGELLPRFPATLPPGAKQKVALARAIVREPNVLLLDEPLSAIDEQFREEMRWEVGHLQKRLGVTTIYVTYDQREAMSLADRIVLMRGGRIVQADAPERIFERPVDTFAGFFIGSPAMNLIDAWPGDGGLVLGQDQGPLLPLPDALTRALAAGGAGQLKLGVRPQHVGLARSPGLGRFRAPIVDRYQIGRKRFFDAKLGEVILQGSDPQGLADQPECWIALELGRIHLFAADSGRRIELGGGG